MLFVFLYFLFWCGFGVLDFGWVCVGVGWVVVWLVGGVYLVFVWVGYEEIVGDFGNFGLGVCVGVVVCGYFWVGIGGIDFSVGV